ncbi:MAG: hypothetical protein ACXWWQ_06625 [Candidatus Limnocylindria bacterium]
MSRLPWDPAEIGTHEEDLDGVADRLTRHAEAETGLPHGTLAARIQAALDDEPLPVGPWWRRTGPVSGWLGPARLIAAAAVLVLGVVGGLALGDFAGEQNSGSGPSPTPVVSPSATPSPTPSPSATPTLSPTPSPSPMSSARITTPPPTATEEAETPEPGEDSGGNSGPGGGGD